MNARAHRVSIPLAALLCVVPLLLRGPSCGHDFDFHLLSWLEAATQLTHGAFPHWAFTPAWNAGEPRFLFYPPLSWLLGALLGTVLPWLYVPAAFTFICLLLGGFAMHRLARMFLSCDQAALAAMLFLANPYMLFTAYERTAYGELLAAAFLPLLLLAALKPGRRPVLTTAAPVALIWLANAPAGVMASYTLAFLCLLRALLVPARRWPQRAQGLVRSGAGLLAGLALAGAYLLPAALEQPLISSGLATVPGMRIVDSTLFHHMAAAPDSGLHDAVVRTASWIAVALLGSIAGATALRWRRWRRDARPWQLPLLTLALVVAFALTPLSLPAWAVLPELRFLQFPWRLLALVAPIAALLVASVLPARLAPSLRTVAPLLFALLLCGPAWQSFRQPCDDEDAVPARVALFHSRAGTEPIDEYTPADADGDALHPGNPPFWRVHPGTAGQANAADAPPPAGAQAGPAPDQLTLTLPTPELLVLNRRQYPLWQVRVNGGPAQPYEPARLDGLITLALPAGVDTVQLRQERSPTELGGLALSLCAGLGCCLLWRRQPAPAKPDSGPAPATPD